MRFGFDYYNFCRKLKEHKFWVCIDNKNHLHRPLSMYGKKAKS